MKTRNEVFLHIFLSRVALCLHVFLLILHVVVLVLKYVNNHEPNNLVFFAFAAQILLLRAYYRAFKKDSDGWAHHGGQQLEPRAWWFRIVLRALLIVVFVGILLFWVIGDITYTYKGTNYFSCADYVCRMDRAWSILVMITSLITIVEVFYSLYMEWRVWKVLSESDDEIEAQIMPPQSPPPAYQPSLHAQERVHGPLYPIHQPPNPTTQPQEAPLHPAMLPQQTSLSPAMPPQSASLHPMIPPPQASLSPAMPPQLASLHPSMPPQQASLKPAIPPPP